MSNDDHRDNARLRQTVREGYAEVASAERSERVEKRCCGTDVPRVTAEAVGYTESELEGLPQGATDAGDTDSQPLPRGLEC